jgi:hypothetical protein
VSVSLTSRILPIQIFKQPSLHRPRCGIPRELPIFFRFALPKEARLFLLPQIEGAERRNGATYRACSLRGSTCQPCGTGSPYGAPLRCLDGGTPLHRPGRHGYYPVALFRRRDGRFHPALLSERGGLLHTSPGTWLARPCARAPHPIHIRSPAGRPSANGDTSAILMRPRSVKHY